jgi:hypothetical protein
MEMRGLSGNIEAKKRIRISASRAALGDLVRSLAATSGFEIADQGPADLVVVEASNPAHVERAFGPELLPVLAIAPRRLSYEERNALTGAGAERIVDSTSSLLDLAFALSELLFETAREQRRYHRAFGGLSVRISSPGNVAGAGHLLGLAREGSYVQADLQPAPTEGAAILLSLDLGRTTIDLRGRVAYAGADGFAVEYALDDRHVAPSLSDLLPVSAPGLTFTPARPASSGESARAPGES